MGATTTMSIVRSFLPNNFKLTDWNSIKPFFKDLLNRPLNSVEHIEKWILDRSQLDAHINETFAWRYINITRDSQNQAYANLYQSMVQELYPRIQDANNRLNKKIVENPFFSQLNTRKYATYIRNVKNSSTLFCNKNIQLVTEVQMKSKEQGRIFSEMTVGLNGVQMTLQKAGSLLEDTDRKCRQNVYHKINQRILQDKDNLETIFDDLLRKRHQIAQNAGFNDFRDYKFKELARFDYTPTDCLHFHNAIKTQILPLLDELNKYRKKTLNLQQLRPWDLNVDVASETPLRPFKSIDDLLNKSILCLNKVHPSFGQNISVMRTKGHLDLAARPGKRPGGYNMPLHATGVPFVFMNATQSFNDLRTLLHESGHAVHSFLTKDYKINFFKKVPSEVSELAAMSMELLTMEHWDVFFDDADDLRRAKINQLETVLKVLPWIATIDKFQHWLYTHPMHSRQERKQQWMRIFKEFCSNEIDISGVEHYSEYIWHKQLHLFEVPFYYVEYGMAQLGAIAIWKNYKENPTKTIQQYINALRLGYSKSIPEIYRTAGIKFDFSKKYITELGVFVKGELEKLLKI